MKPELQDEQEEDRARGLAEQCWLGPLCLLFWVLIILACIHGCAKGAECWITWNDAPPVDQVTHWKIYRGIDLLATTTLPAAILNLPTDRRSTLSVVAVNLKGDSMPTIITVVPFTPRHTTDLRNWTPHPSKVFFIEATAKAFANFSFPAL